MRSMLSQPHKTTDDRPVGFAPASRPVLADKTLLRIDRRSGRSLLLYPERGLELNPTAGDIVRLCTGEWDIGQIVTQLTRRYGDISREALEEDVCRFLQTLMDRGLLHAR